MQCRNCHLAQTGISAGFCCRKCVRAPDAHGPFCEQRLLKCRANCGFAVTRHGATHCCLRCEHGEPHGPRCKRIYAEAAPGPDRFVGPRCLPSEFQLGDRVQITSGGRHEGETGMVVHVGTGGENYWALRYCVGRQAPYRHFHVPRKKKKEAGQVSCSVYPPACAGVPAA